MANPIERELANMRARAISRTVFSFVWMVLFFCAPVRGQEIKINQKFPVKDPKTGQASLSPPKIEQTNECASRVKVTSFIPGATIDVYLTATSAGPVSPKKLIGGPTPLPVNGLTVHLTQTLKAFDQLEATQTVTGVTSAVSAPMIAGPMPTSLPKPTIDGKNVYACGVIAPVYNLESGVNVEVFDKTTGSTTPIGTDSTPNDWGSNWDPVLTLALDAPPKTAAAHEIHARQSACNGAKSDLGPAVAVQPQPSTVNQPGVQSAVVGNNVVTLDKLLTGAIVQIFNGSTPLNGPSAATGDSNWFLLTKPLTATIKVKPEQKLCQSSTGKREWPTTSSIPQPELVSPICPGQSTAYVRNSTINAALVLLKGNHVVGYGGAALGNAPVNIAPPAVFSTGDVIRVAEYFPHPGSPVVFSSNTVTVGSQVRMRWQDFISGPDGAKRLTSLKAGIKKMKSLNASPPGSADFRRSWAYWANIHGYYGSMSPDGTVAEHTSWLQSMGLGSDVSYYSGISDQSPPDSIAKTIWATCQHGAPGGYFFGWHRMWLYYLERVLRWAAADDTLCLPYWDYTNPTQVALPTEFQNTASDLYDALRDPGVNTGTPLDAKSTDVDGYLSETDFFTFENDIENNIHSYVHCTVGPTCPVAHMGDVPVAGNDAIFLAHHANIDRLWACWQYLYPTPAGPWQNQQFSFVDETGTMQTQPVKNFLDSSALCYVYDNVSDCAREKAKMRSFKEQKQAMPARAESTKAVLGSVKAVPIMHALTTVDISVSPSELQHLLSQPQGAATVGLILRDVTAQSPPGVLFDVYVARKGDAATRKFAGTLSWFGAFDHHGGAGPMNRTFHFPVTKQLSELLQSNTSDLTIIIEATTGRVPVDRSKAEAARADAAKSFRSEAKLQIGAIELEARGG